MGSLARKVSPSFGTVGEKGRDAFTSCQWAVAGLDSNGCPLPGPGNEKETDWFLRADRATLLTYSKTPALHRLDHALASCPEKITLPFNSIWSTKSHSKPQLKSDPENPLNFPIRQKWIISSVGIIFCGLVSLSVSGYAIAQKSIIRDLETTKTLAVLGLTTFTVMFGGSSTFTF